MPSLKEQVISSSKWAVLNQLVTQGIRIAVSIYMMRLIAPENFGIFMKVLSVIGISEILVGMRLGGGIIQSQNITKEQIATIFWITIFGSFVLSSIIYFSAGLISSFYEDQRLESITKLLSLVLIFMGIGYVPRAILTKELQFKKIFIANSIGMITSSVVGVWMALHNYEYWSLVWQWIIFNSLTPIAFTILSDFKTSPKINPKEIKNIWAFSKRLMIDDSLNYGVRNLDNILIGKFLGAGQLGFYSRAYGLMLLPLQNFVNIIRGVLFPAFSKIQKDKIKIKRIFLLSTQSISFLLLPFFLFTIIYASELIEVVFGDKWLPISPLIKIFLLLAIVQSHTILVSSVYLSLGRTDIILKLSYVTKPIIIIAMLIAIQYGLMPMVITVVVLNSITSLISLHLGLALINSGLFQYLKSLKHVLRFNSVILIIMLIQYYFIPLEVYDVLSLMTILTTTLIVYILAFEKTKPHFYVNLKAQLFNIS